MTKRRLRSVSQQMRATEPGELPCRFTAFFDGCCEPKNPGGTAGFGAVIFDANRSDRHCRYGERVHDISGMIPASPTTSNNIAEYLAINAVMDWMIANNHQDETIHVWGDSRLVICQLWGWPIIGSRWKIHGVDCLGPNCKQCHGKRGFYVDAALQAREKLKRLPRMLGFWISRDQNDIADELSKAELKKAGVEFKIQPESNDTEYRV